jgi:hypothetical protein
VSPITSYSYTSIYDAIENIHTFRNEKDERVIHAYVQKVRDMGTTPGKTVERALEWAEKFLLAAHPDMGQVLTMPLALWYVENIAKEVGIHAGQRRKEKEKEAEALLTE